MAKKIAVYGTCEFKVHVKQRYWKVRKDGIKQRYWIKTKRMKTVEDSRRFEIYGKGKDLYKAVVKAHRFMPKERFVTVSAEKFLKHPETYGLEGVWIEREVES